MSSLTQNSARTGAEPAKHLRLLSFNVEGLDSMLLDPSFMELIDKHDICILTETMRSTDEKLNLDGFWDFSQIRPKPKDKKDKAGRYSGGITALLFYKGRIYG